MTHRVADARRALLGKGSIYTIATAFQLVGALLVLPAISRLLPRAEYGAVALATVVTILVGMVASAGLPAVITRSYCIDGEGPAAARRLVTLAVAVAAAVSAVAFAAGPLWAAPVGGFTTSLALGTTAGLAWAWMMIGQAVLRAASQAGRYVVVALVNVLGGQLLGLGLVWWVSASASVYLAGVAAGAFVAAVLALVWVRPARRWGGRTQVRQAFAIALPTLPHSAALYLMLAGDRFVIEAQRGADAVASYSLAYQTGALAITVIAAANNAWAPIVYGARDDRRWPVLAATTTDMLRVAAVLAAGLALTAPLALVIIADPSKYDIAELVPVVAITALAAVPYTLYLAGAHQIFWSGKTTPLLWITPLAMVLNIGGKALVLPWGGFVGAAVVTVGAYAVLAFLVTWAARPIGTVPWSGRFPAIVAAAMACTIGALLPANAMGYLARGLLTLAVVAAGLWAIRQFLADRRVAAFTDAR